MVYRLNGFCSAVVVLGVLLSGALNHSALANFRPRRGRIWVGAPREQTHRTYERVDEHGRIVHRDGMASPIGLFSVTSEGVPWLMSVVRTTLPRRRLTVLSLGEGHGQFAAALQKKGYDVDVCESSEPIMQRLRERATGLRETWLADARDLLPELGANPQYVYDLVVFNSSLGAIGLNALRHVPSLLVPGGGLFVMEQPQLPSANQVERRTEGAYVVPAAYDVCTAIDASGLTDRVVVHSPPLFGDLCFKAVGYSDARIAEERLKPQNRVYDFSVDVYRAFKPAVGRASGSRPE